MEWIKNGMSQSRCLLKAIKSPHLHLCVCVCVCLRCLYCLPFHEYIYYIACRCVCVLCVSACVFGGCRGASYASIIDTTYTTSLYISVVIVRSCF